MKKLYNKFRNMKYRWKLVLAMLVVSVVPLCVSSLFFTKGSRDSIMENLMQAKKAQMDQAEQELQGKMQVYEHITDFILSMQSLQEVLALDESQPFELYKGYTEVVDPMLETNRYYHPVILQMTIYLKNVNFEHGTTIAPYSTLESDEWFRNAFADGDVTEKWIISNEPRMVYYVRPIMRYGKLQAAMVTRFDYEEFLSGLETIPTYESEVVCLVAADGTIVYCNYEEALGKNRSEYEEWDYISRNQELEEFGVSLISAFPRSVVADSMRSSMTGNTILQAVCIVYAIVVSLLLARTLVSRIVRLTDIVRRIGEKYEDENGENLAELRQYTGPQDEVGILVEDIRGMVERLNELKIAVYREKIARRDLEMKALQAQINPHFLYNSLSIINWKAIEAEADEVSGITLRLAEFYRTTLNRGSSIISVDGEIRNIRSYLDIQLIMHDNNFQVHWEIDNAALQWQMPKLVLQPLVENSLEHGLDLKEDDDRQLLVRVATEDNDLVLIVRDNGVGMTQEKADSLVHYNSRGYGVKNVKERIELLYGEKHTFRITSKEGEGTEIYIRIPGERGRAS